MQAWPGWRGSQHFWHSPVGPPLLPSLPSACWAVLWLFAKPGDGHYCKPQKSSTHLSPSFPSFQLGALRHCAVAVCQLSEPKARQQLHATLCKWEFQLTHKNSSEKKKPNSGRGSRPFSSEMFTMHCPTDSKDQGLWNKVSCYCATF